MLQPNAVIIYLFQEFHFLFVCFFFCLHFLFLLIPWGFSTQIIKDSLVSFILKYILFYLIALVSAQYTMLSRSSERQQKTLCLLAAGLLKILFIKLKKFSLFLAEFNCEWVWLLFQCFFSPIYCSFFFFLIHWYGRSL